MTIQHKKEFRDYLAGLKRPSGKRRIEDESVDSYVRYLNAVSWGIDTSITPKLVRSRKVDDIAEDAAKKPLRGKRGGMPKPNYVIKWKRALKHYHEMCEEKGL